MSSVTRETHSISLLLAEYRKQSVRKRALKTVLVYLDRNTGLARAVDLMMARAKNLRFDDRNKRVIFLSLSRIVFLKKWKSFSVFLTRAFGRTGKTCGNTRLRLEFQQQFSFSQTSIRVSITEIEELRKRFSIS